MQKDLKLDQAGWDIDLFLEKAYNIKRYAKKLDGVWRFSEYERVGR